MNHSLKKQLKITLLIAIGLLITLNYFTNSNSYYVDYDQSNYSNINIIEDTTPPTISNVEYIPTNPDNKLMVLINCTITDSSDIYSATVYHTIDEVNWYSSILSVVSGTDNYEAEIGLFDTGDIVKFYITATDDSPIHNTRTDDNYGSYYSFTVSEAELTTPTISNISTTPNNPTNVESFEICCDVTDVSGIAYVILSYRINSGSWINKSMENISGNNYHATFDPLNVDDIVEYKIIAIDNSNYYNTTIDDNNGNYYSITIVQNDTNGPIISSITITPTEPTADAIINISCSIVDDYNGIESAILYYRVNNGTWVEVEFSLIEGNIYQAQVGPFDKNDFVEFYFVATDNSSNSNEAIYDNDGNYYNFTVGKSTESASLSILIPISIILLASYIYRKRKY